MVASQAFRQRSLERRQDRRRFQRVTVSLLGRYMLEDRREYPCQTVDMSPGSAALVAPVSGRMGERVVVYIDQIGRIEGIIVRSFQGGFAISINATLRKKDKLAAKLTWLANRSELNLAEDRRHERVIPANPLSVVVLPDGRELPCRVVDLSFSGAALALEGRPPIGSPVWVGKIKSSVVRHFEDGIAIEFAVTQTRESVEANFA
jgi:hypothetical protein